MSLFVWLDAGIISFSMLVAIALALQVIFTNPRRRLNWLFCLFALAVGYFYIFSLLLRASLWLQVGKPQWMLEMATLSFAITGPLLLLFANRYTLRSTYWADLFALVCMAMIILLAVPLFDGQLIFEPRLHPDKIIVYQISLSGYLASIVPLASMVAAYAVFWFERSLRLAIAILLIIAGFLGGTLLRTPFPVTTLASALGMLILGYEVINRQVLNPYKDRTHELEREIDERRRVEGELQRSEAHFRGIFENALMGIYRSTPEGRLLMANPALLEMLGLASYDEIRSYNLNGKEFASDPPRSVFKQRMEAEGQVVGVEFAWKRSDGSLVFVRESARAVRGENGHALYYEGTVEDVSERVEAERALQRSLRELQNIQQITESLLSQSELYETMQTVAKGIVTHLGYDMVLIIRYIEAENAFTGLAIYPLPPPEVFDPIPALIDYESVKNDPQGFRVHYGRGENKLVDRVLDGEVVKSNNLGDIFSPWFPRAAAKVIQKITKLNSFINLPLRVSRQPVGTIIAGVRAQRIPLEQEQALLRVADQAAMVLEKARLLDETQRQLREQIAIKNASAAISSALEPEVVLNRIAEQMGQAVDATSSYISSYDIETMKSTVLAEYISPNASSKEVVTDLGETYLDDDPDFLQAMLLNHPYIAHSNATNLSEAERVSMQVYGARTILYIPLLIGNQLIGIVEMWESRRNREFTHAEISLCQGIAQQAAIAIENARLHKKVQSYAETLEARVAERTAELENANRELQAFSYSVSHDLRAPLRGIDGYSKALLEEYTDLLDEQGMEYLRRVRQAAQKMDLLIDEILKLSRVTRHEMEVQEVNLSRLVKVLADEAVAAEPGRAVEFEIADGMMVWGDHHLLTIALRNLIGNAMKFTSGRPTAYIQFGAREVDGRQVFFIQDNGAGFNMAYQDKLFEAFHRLHAEHEFPGSGIGLSIVQRVIKKHHGCIWAEGEVGRGATFNFTLDT